MAELWTIVLAAGKGTRMKSARPKVLHRVCGKPMLDHVLAAASEAGAARQIAVVGFGADEVRRAAGGAALFALQEEQLGTGHAVMQARPLCRDFDGAVMILCGDTPLLTGRLLRRFYEAHQNGGAAATVLTAELPDAAGYGRIVRDSLGQVIKIVEQKDAAPAELLIREVNTGIYCFDSQTLWRALDEITCDNAQREYYLTDVIGVLTARRIKTAAVRADDYRETLGINDRAQLAEAEKILRRRKNERLMADGVTMMDPASTFVDMDVTVGRDTVLYPFTWLEGATAIGRDCAVGPHTRLADVTVGDRATLHFTYAHECAVADGAVVGPYVHLRPRTKIGKNVKIGNFVEVKNSTVGESSKVPHLSYIGDADVGQGVNIGCGSITVNYDGNKKHRTTIEDGAFVGCNSNLVAPVTVRKNAYVGAGSTITKDVPEDALGVARARQTNLEGWTGRRK